MSDINLDPRKLLGFKIVANGEGAATLRSPKIGTKNCTVLIDDLAPIASSSPIAAQIGFEIS